MRATAAPAVAGSAERDALHDATRQLRAIRFEVNQVAAALAVAAQAHPSPARSRQDRAAAAAVAAVQDVPALTEIQLRQIKELASSYVGCRGRCHG